MPIIRSATAPRFALPGLAVTGLAAPSRGARESSVWRLALAAGAPGAPHSVDREEIFVALSGRAIATLAGESHELAAGDALIVPAGETFALSNPGPEPFEAIALAPCGVRARMAGGGEAFCPPWTE
ncbi:MAG: cupin domain-containing protein [Deltaproteobacteria bacterium]|nr:cupin domain-containing protein [Deltaproteobacteria bacterium]